MFIVLSSASLTFDRTKAISRTGLMNLVQLVSRSLSNSFRLTMSKLAGDIWLYEAVLSPWIIR